MEACFKHAMLLSSPSPDDVAACIEGLRRALGSINAMVVGDGHWLVASTPECLVRVIPRRPEIHALGPAPFVPRASLTVLVETVCSKPMEVTRLVARLISAVREVCRGTFITVQE